jgi:hypothetical protein
MNTLNGFRLRLRVEVRPFGGVMLNARPLEVAQEIGFKTGAKTPKALWNCTLPK